MTRVKRGVTARKRHKKVLKQAKGMGHARRSSYRLANQAVRRSLQYAYRDRRNRKRDLRRLWITRINAGARQEGLSYSKLTGLLKKSQITLDRKILAELAVNWPDAFKAVLEQAKNKK